MTERYTIELTPQEAVELRRIAHVTLPPYDDLRVTAFFDEERTYSALKKLIAVLPDREEA